MTRKLTTLLVALGLVVVLVAMGSSARSGATPPDSRTTEANVTRLTAGLLEHSQFAHHPLDGALAGKLIERYLDALDGTRSLFLQADTDQFTGDRTALAQATRGAGDTRAAHVIFARYLERLQQRVAYLTRMLQTAAFDFTGHDTYNADREHAQRPRDLAEAHQLWREQLRADYLVEQLDNKPPDQIVAMLTRRYAQHLKMMEALGPDEVLEIYLDALTHVYDPHSDYLGHEQMDSFAIGMNLSLVGIGATLEDKDGYCTIHALVPGGPAARSGLLKPGDRIVAVAEANHAPIDIVNMPLTRVVELIRGAKRSTVTLQVLPAGTADGVVPRTESIVRDEVDLKDQQASARILDLPTADGPALRIGVVELPSFYADMGNGASRRSATTDVARLVGKLEAEHVHGIVMDLRRNGGGSLGEAISLTGLFIRTGPVVQTRDPAGHIEIGADRDPGVLYDGPLVLLTSRFSASATEILAGALQDYGRALVVGDSSTFGKGSVQNIQLLAPLMDKLDLAHAYDPGALKITTEKFYRPSGASTQLRGVASDIVLPSTSEVSGVSESALQDPLPWDTVPPATYTHLDRVAPYVAELRERSARRLASDKDFGELVGDIARFKRDLAAKSISLNEAERRRELVQDKVRERARDEAERRLRQTSPTTYAITVDNAGAPGLPAPVVPGRDPDPASELASDPGAALGGDLVLRESERILADYVSLVAPHADQTAATRYVRPGRLLRDHELVATAPGCRTTRAPGDPGEHVQ